MLEIMDEISEMEMLGVLAFAISHIWQLLF